MENNIFDLRQMKAQELTFEELMNIEGGGFGHTLGIILGIATVVVTVIALISLVGPGAALMAII
jgi:bacteriocin-like protein